MRLPFALTMARRETRAGRRRIGVSVAAIALGVAALVAINAFRRDVAQAIGEQSRQLLGADLELSSRRPFPDPVPAVLDSLEGAGVPVSRVTSLASMALAVRTGGTRLVQLRAVSGGYPYYGTIETAPPGRWAALHRGRHALVDRALLVQLDANVGDTLAIGQTRFVILGALTRVPGEVVLRAAIGPRVYVPAAYLAETELLTRGSLARYAAYLELPDNARLQGFLNRHNALFRNLGVGYDTVSEREDELTGWLDALARYLGLVGLVALLLGGLGIASAVHVYVRDKVATVAILRCLGARQWSVFAIYLLQAAAMGLAGAAVGVALGLGVQWALPRLLGDLLPLVVTPRLRWETVLAGLGVGAWVAAIFALLPLLAIRDVPPLAALRHDVEPARRTDLPRIAAYGALAASLVGLALWQAPHRAAGLAFAAAVSATTVLLWAVARGLMAATRRFFPGRAPYVVRQGVANLFRPHNQTVAVTLAVGFGVFLLGTLQVVQRNLLDRMRVDARPDRPNLVVFDIQPDQLEDVRATLAARRLPTLQVTPIVPARIARVNGQSVQQLLDSGASRWPLRREYRHTYRDTLVASERVVEGRWWEGAAGAVAGRPARISVEQDIAEELGVGVGDRITWDVQGVLVETEITSLRRVEWARFEPNFFVVFESGVLEEAPQTYVTMTRADDPTARAEVQRDLVRQHPNLSAIDLSLVQRTLDTIVGSVAFAIRFVALFSLASGAIVLAGAVATSRFQRLKESVLLRTLGARARQVRQIILTEYGALGALAGVSGGLLAVAAGWGLVRFFFELRFYLPLGSLALLVAGGMLLTTAVGLAGSREALRATPLAVMREMGSE